MKSKCRAAFEIEFQYAQHLHYDSKLNTYRHKEKPPWDYSEKTEETENEIIKRAAIVSSWITWRTAWKQAILFSNPKTNLTEVDK